MDIQLNVLVSFIAGLLSFLSPCVLAIAPAYISYISGVESIEKERKKVFIHTLLFVIGFMLVFILMGVGASYLGSFLLRYKIWFNRIAGIIIILFGLQILGVLKIKMLYAEKRIRPRQSWAKMRSVLLGITFGLGWTPCVGPILGSILLYVSTLGNVVQGGIYLSFYAIGLAIPFILLGFGWGYMIGLFRNLQKRGHIIEIISGILLIFLGAVIMLNQMNSLISILRLDNMIPGDTFFINE
jgi:cytochrome c-type biogenesis protein